MLGQLGDMFGDEEQYQEVDFPQTYGRYKNCSADLDLPPMKKAPSNFVGLQNLWDFEWIIWHL